MLRSGAVPWEQVRRVFGLRLIRGDRHTSRERHPTDAPPAENAILVGISSGPRARTRIEASMDELAQLTRSAGARVVGSLVQERKRAATRPR